MMDPVQNTVLTTGETISSNAGDKYKYGFVTDIESDRAPKGLNEDIVRFIAQKKNEPEWMLEWRLRAYRHWLTMSEPKWAFVEYPPIDYQDAYYFAAPKRGDGPKSVDEIDPKLLEVLVCPQTRTPLRYDRERQELISEVARLAYPVRDGVAILVADEARELDPDE